MPFDDDRTPVLRALEHWAAGDLERTLEEFSEDILFLINVDSHAVPFLASSLGKEDLRQRLQLIKATFHEDLFEPESIIHEADYTRVLVNVELRHRIGRAPQPTDTATLLGGRRPDRAYGRAPRRPIRRGFSAFCVAYGERCPQCLVAPPSRMSAD